MSRPATMMIAGLSALTAVQLSSCVLAPFLEASLESDFEEVSEFAVQPGTMTAPRPDF